jgi:hypothetical protein
MGAVPRRLRLYVNGRIAQTREHKTVPNVPHFAFVQR